MRRKDFQAVRPIDNIDKIDKTRGGDMKINPRWMGTAHRGLRYWEHPNRKHGKKKDRYYAIRFMVDGKEHNFGVGWLSGGIPDVIRQAEPEIGFEDYCLKLLRQFKANSKVGEGIISLKEKRILEGNKKAAETARKKQEERENITFADFFTQVYTPIAAISKKRESARKEQEHFRNWINPIVGKVPIKKITPFLLEKLKKSMLDAGKTPRSIQYVFATIRQTWNLARRDGYVSGDSPTRNVRLPKIDNRRVRFLSHAEAEDLLEDLKVRDIRAHDMTLIALNTGMRIGEIVNLKWSHIDTDVGIIHVLDTKNGKSRNAYITERLKALFRGMHRGKPEDFVFERVDGSEKLNAMPRSFFKAVSALGLNRGITDPRQKVVAHTLRHTFASWHAMSGTDIFTLKELLGHSVIQMTERYSHLSPEALRRATDRFSETMTPAKTGQVVNLNIGPSKD